jgi:hypothetical protein
MSKIKLQQQVLNQEEMLQIKGKGQLISSGGFAGSNKVIIRGMTSINGSTEPLYVVDGTSTDGNLTTKVASSSISATSGQPGAAPVVRIRGTQGG